MVLNVTFNNILYITWRSVLLFEETEVLEGVVIGTDYIGSCRSN